MISGPAVLLWAMLRASGLQILANSLHHLVVPAFGLKRHFVRKRREENMRQAALSSMRDIGKGSEGGVDGGADQGAAAV
jgi:hypothetical protein